MKYIIEFGCDGGESKIIGWAHDVTQALCEVSRIIGKETFEKIPPLKRGKSGFLFNFVHQNKTKYIKISKIQEIFLFQFFGNIGELCRFPSTLP